MKKRLGASERLYPMPCPLVVGGTIEEADALAVAWINIVSSTPATLAMGIRRTRHTLHLIRRTGTFTVNLPDTKLVTETDYCGITTGRTKDKFAATGLTLVPSTQVPAPMIEECPYNLECRVKGEVELGEYILMIGEILEAHADERILNEAGDAVDVDRLDPLVYIAGSREYRRLGGKVADAFSVGKSIADKEREAPAEES